ncbi:MAG: hypothetical protein M0Q38_01405 [Bacteroidales bacterium]|jgi:hypothetical protein|nr:hypothetical protein [Bacteroidales bacterium]
MPTTLLRKSSLVLGVNGLAIYSLLAAYANKNFRSRLEYHKISRKLGCTKLEAIMALHKLENLHLIKAEPQNSRTKSYQLLWIPPWGKIWGKDCGKSGERIFKLPCPYRFDYSIKYKIANDIDGTVNKLSFNNNMNQSEETQLAYELAEALNDQEAIQMYIAYTNRFPEALLREILVKVLSVPDYKIRKTRGALFNYLIQQHARKTDYYSRD